MMNSFVLKLLAIIFMVFDHVYTYIPKYPIWFGYVGKLAAPIFFFMIVEGFIYTRNRKKYIIRLFGFAIIMVALDYILKIPNNIFLSLGCGIVLLTVLDYGKRTKKYALSTIAAIVIGILMLFTEASLYGLGMVLIFYFLREKKGLKIITYILFSLFFLLTNLGALDLFNQLFLYDYQWMMVFAFPFFLLYNGKKGYSSTFMKWAFYVFYSLHLTVIILIKELFIV
ncbi:conjugal transfer protein TraX [Bacillus halotolerans]|nr:conjugal transfer protein TraX [Bacillus halotolerans]